MTKRLTTLVSATAIADIDHWLTKFPADQRQSALLQTLRIIQDEHDWLSEALLNAAADYLEIPAIAAYEVATFYSMYNLKPTGKHRIDICTNVSCMLRGSDKVVSQFEEKLGIKMGETTDDGQFTLNEVECLGVCINAPVCQIGRQTFEDVDNRKVNDILVGLEKNG